MNSSGRIVRSLLWSLLFGWMLWLLRRWLVSAMGGRQRSGANRQEAAEPIRLHRDPVCGTHVAPEISFPLEQAGGREYFCSAECREKFLQSERHAINA